MSLANHTLVLPSGQASTLLDLGVLSAVATHTAQGEDTLDLELPAEIDAASICAAWDEVALLDQSGTRRFLGYCLGLPRVASGREQRHTLKFKGPNALLERITYRQLAYFAPVNASYNSIPSTTYVSRVILNRNSLTGATVTMAAQIASAMDFANLALASAGRAALNYSTAGLDPILIAPEDEQRDRSVLDVIQTELRWSPESTARWDYTTSPPTFRFGDPIHSSALRGFSGLSVETVDVARNETFSADPRPDLLVPIVRLFFIYELAATDIATGKAKNWILLSTDSSIVANGGFGEITATIVLRPYVYNGLAFVGGEPIPVGLARAMHAAFARPQIEMSWTTVADEVDWFHQPCEVWNVTSGGTVLSSAMSVCQSITRHIGEGRVTYQTGPPAHLGLNDILAILRAAWLRKQPISAGEQEYGFKAPDSSETDSGGTKVKIVAAKQDAGGNTFSKGILSVPADWFE